jgi:glutathione S-transferase
MTPLRLHTNSLCPYAHRVRLVMAEKGISAEHVEVDLRTGPAPLGKVPLLEVGSQMIGESAVIAEYLEESYPEPSLLPRDPLARARARVWIRFADDRLYAHTTRLLHASATAERDLALGQIHEDLRFMEHHGFAVARHGGPYWMGERFTLVDVTFFPWFEQRAALERFRNFAWPEDCPRLLEWEGRVARRLAVRGQSRPPAFYVNEYALRAG